MECPNPLGSKREREREERGGGGGGRMEGVEVALNINRRIPN